METIAVSEFRSNLLNILKRIENGSTIIITSRGRPVAQLIPPEDTAKNARNKLKSLAKTALIKDVLSPIDEKWKVTE